MSTIEDNQKDPCRRGDNEQQQQQQQQQQQRRKGDTISAASTATKTNARISLRRR
jgi:hypothetical protein